MDDVCSDAIEGAAVMLYGVSLAYKESANCRLEANYAHQCQVEMIPIMMERGYSPRGWLGTYYTRLCATFQVLWGGIFD